MLFEKNQPFGDCIVNERKDYRAVEELTREAFGNVYKPGADEHYYTKAWLEDENGIRKEILSFGSLCIASEHQRQKFGQKLIEHSFETARKMGYDVNINFGNPGNYVSRGFLSCKKKNVSFIVEGNFPTALFVCELIPGALDGRKWMPSQEEFYIYSHSSVVR